MTKLISIKLFRFIFSAAASAIVLVALFTAGQRYLLATSDGVDIKAVTPDANILSQDSPVELENTAPVQAGFVGTVSSAIVQSKPASNPKVKADSPTKVFDPTVYKNLDFSKTSKKDMTPPVLTGKIHIYRYADQIEQCEQKIVLDYSQIRALQDEISQLKQDISDLYFEMSKPETTVEQYNLDIIAIDQKAVEIASKENEMISLYSDLQFQQMQLENYQRMQDEENR